jgi:hypothetical protein
MRKIFGLFAILVLAVACKPEIKDIGPKYTAGDGIYGKWSLSGLTMIDITQPVPESRVLDSYVAQPSRQMIITFNSDGSYVIDQQGVIPADFGTNGTWAYNQTEFPSGINFYSSDGDTIASNLLNMPRTIDVNFGFEFTRSKCDAPYLTYQLTFNRN